MPTITFVRPDGTAIPLTGKAGDTVMRLASSHGIPEILAECGGACACATCHVIVDDAWVGRLPPMGTMEADMIEFAQNPTPASRLSCQLTIDATMDGLVLHMPEA